MKLYTFWRSQASYRVRIALALKGLEASLESVDLLKGEQADAGYRRINPEMVVPTLVDDQGERYFQSLAIIEYLDEVYPNPRLLPDGSRERAYVRAIAQTIACDAHPLIVPRVRNYLRDVLALDEGSVTNWLRHWLDGTTEAVEAAMSKCRGDEKIGAQIILRAISAPLKQIADNAGIDG